MTRVSALQRKQQRDETALRTEIRTVLARLELCSTCSASAYDTSGSGDSEDPGGKRPLGPAFSADTWYRARLTDLDAGHPRKVPRKPGENEKVRDTYEQLLRDARGELTSLTGHTDQAPHVKHHKMETPEGVKAAAHEDAPGKPADIIARQFGVTQFTARRWYVEWDLGPDDGKPLATTTQARTETVVQLLARGLSTRDIAKRLDMHQTQVMRELRKTAA